MNRIVRFVLGIGLMISLCGCKGNYEPVYVEDKVELKEGVIAAEVLADLKSNNAIGTFEGQAGDFSYEWLVFGSDITEVKDLDLSLEIKEKGSEEFVLCFGTKDKFDIPLFLSVYLNEKWNTQKAFLYSGEEVVSELSVTGSKKSIINISVLGMQGEYIVRADNTYLPEEEQDSFVEQEDASGSQAVVNDKTDSYLSSVADSSGRVYSSGTASMKDKYETDPVPEGKPMPVEPENQIVSTEKKYTCTFSIECSTILNNLGDLDPDKLELVPSDGVILAPTQVEFYEGESVFDVLQRVCRENGIHVESSWTPVYNSAYIEGIHNLYEFDCGQLSGWMYRVNGWYPNYGCSRYQLAAGEVVEWRYTCDLGRDVGCEWME